MNNNTNIHASKATGVLSFVAFVAGAVWFIGEIANYLPLEILISISAIAGLLALGYLDIKQGSPKRFPIAQAMGYFSSRIRKIFTTRRSNGRVTA